jgi:RHS repeat-associated protein
VLAQKQAAPTCSYDSNGNLSQKVEAGVTWTHVWDAENRLKWVCNTTPCTEAASVASFQYDPFGRRVEKIAGGITTTYTYDREDILRQVAGGSTLKFVHGPGIDEPLAQEDGAGALSYFHADGLGSIVNTTSSAGAVTSTRVYDAFGNFELGATNGYAFTGREWDTETGLAHYRARYYDPKIGRFIGEDPIGLNNRPWVELNAYAYVGNNPIVRVDPTGEAS